MGQTKYTVLIIDDEIHIRRLIGRMLQGAGYRAIETGNGHEALAILADPENRPDIITCDIAMPDMNGFQILEAVRSNPDLDDIPVIMLTAMGQQEDATRAEEKGASNYITKPFSAMNLIDVLEEELNKVQERKAQNNQD